MDLAEEQAAICSICQCDFEVLKPSHSLVAIFSSGSAAYHFVLQDGEYAIVIRNCSHSFHVQVQFS